MYSSADANYDLTVITVCMNVLADVQRSVESVLAQKALGSLQIEHLIVDGASTDGTPEWLAAAKAEGRIEAYVSEKDGGIYPAMNKGIALARGRVLAFLNAGDRYADQDLAVLVRPILEGSVAASCGAALCHTVEGTQWVYRPTMLRAWWDQLGCHQAYFASAEAYRAVHGYDAVGFRSAADCQMMNDIMRAFGAPLMRDDVVVHFEEGGFSTGFWKVYRHEIIEIHARAWDKLSERCREDADFRRMMAAMLAWHCLEVIQMTPEKRRKAAAQIEKLVQMCREIPGIPGALRLALNSCVGFVKRAMKHDKPVAKWQWALFQLPHFICAVPHGNPYKRVYIGPSKKQIVAMFPKRLAAALSGRKR